MENTYLIIAQFVVDLFLIATLIYLILSAGHRSKVEEEKRVHGLLNVLDMRVYEANTVLSRLSTETGDCISSVKDVINGLESRKTELQIYLERIDGILKAIDEVAPAGDVPVLISAGEERDRYKEASRLAEKGFSIDEIVQRVGIPRGEVQLIMGLKRSE